MILRGWIPRWWAGQGGALGRVADLALAPAEAAFRAIAGARGRAYDRGMLRSAVAPIPTVSVGNIAVGGAGKTPVAAWIAARLRRRGRHPAVVLRGYGADEVEVHRELNPDVPVFAAKRRLDGVRAAAEAGCDCAVVDDGFQHRALRRDLDLVLVAVEGWTGAPRLLPRGPWREPPESLRRAHLVVVTRKSADEAARDAVLRDLAAIVGEGCLAACHLEPTRLRPLHPGRRTQRIDWLRGRRVVAVAALATPEPFLAQLRHAGAEVEARLYADHHEFTPEEADRVRAAAGERRIVMTLKDAVKLRRLLGPEVDAWVLHQAVTLERGEELIDAALSRALEAARG
jgi:tetraacyldisaccharide 4'-kinase